MKIEECSQNLRSRFCEYYKKLNIDGKGKIYVGLIITLLIISIFAYTYNTAYIVKIDGKELGIVRTEKDFKDVLDNIQKRLHRVHGKNIIIQESIVYERTKAKDQELTELKDIEKAIQKMIHFEVKAYGIKAGDQVIAAIAKKEEAEEVLEEIKKAYIDEEKKYEKVYFAEGVKIDTIDADITSLKTGEDATKMILQGTEEEQVHEVEQGESFWTIAKKYKLSVDDLIKANPNVNPERLQIKQKISLIVPKPLLTVATVEKVTLEEAIPYEVKFEETSVLYKGDKKIRVKGEDGKREIIAEVVSYNGVEHNRKVLEEKIEKEPKTQIVLKGTKNPPPKKGTGKLSNPTRGRLTSPFGWRWGRKHTGIDVANPIGTSIKAADGGVVIYAGWKGAYGKCVIIDHGGNTQTWYAHNSKILVTKGQKVFKGQTISKMGSTGNSTGSHLHFEVRKNGTPVNPLRYVRY
ncbi:MAG: peptidoglycan DD-metalloendopeptidase family protein [Marinisporobacter sp.]|jgi:murein DD-endopeptidase MepM/ murein hydrolase activator NlpD|nr:peptidoglycan DD-metalloendopeptidase family protein [Marinisporobacter sp.]